MVESSTALTGTPGTTAQANIACTGGKVLYGVSAEVTKTTASANTVQGAVMAAFPAAATGSSTAGSAVGVVTGSAGTFDGFITAIGYCGNP